MIGEVLGNRYELVEKIGEGGMAIVYKARDNKLSRLVAVKVLKKEFANNKDISDKFKKEALPLNEGERQNFFFLKEKQTPSCYPRPWATILKKPLL